MLVGIFSVIATMRFGRTLLSEFGSNSEARVISMALLQAQRGSITAGENHFISFDSDPATNYRVVRRTGGGDVVVEGPHDYQPGCDGDCFGHRNGIQLRGADARGLRR